LRPSLAWSHYVYVYVCVYDPDRYPGCHDAAVVPGRFAAAIGSTRWIATLSALTAVVALSIDMSLPAQPTLVDELHVGPMSRS